MWNKYLVAVLFVLISISCIAKSCIAKDLGVVGTIFSIKEQSLLEVIIGKLRALEASDALKDHQKVLQERVKKSIEHPKGVEGIKTTVLYTSKDYDPSILIDETIKDHRGNLIALKGTKINPLDYHTFGKSLILINGDDESQVIWALSQVGKIVLTQGAPLHLNKTHERKFYFDQGAVLANKFQITSVPARISQNGKKLLVEEIPMEGLSSLSQRRTYEANGEFKNG
jgi:conjugal transfer pilus assembly protein TraW